MREGRSERSDVRPVMSHSRFGRGGHSPTSQPPFYYWEAYMTAQRVKSIIPFSIIHFLLLSCFSGMFVVPAQAGEASRAVTAQATQGPMVVDGQAQEAVWQDAEVTQGFIQKEPDDGKPATQNTRVRLAFDSSNLYVFAELEDQEPTRVTRLLTRRDRDSESDWFGILVDARHDHRSGRLLLVNASGVQRDVSISGDANMDASWDGVWESMVVATPSGWAAELRIPLSLLRFSDLENATWGFNAIRYVSRLKEQSFWAPIPQTASRLVGLCGHLDGMVTHKVPMRLALTPYASARGALQADASGLGDGALLPNAGIDLQYGLTQELTLDLTLNPDFGQVEVDETVIQLSAFETRLTEKRGFFLEGADIFSTSGATGDEGSAQLFYSRRIGQDQPILAATRLTGRTRKGLSVGFLHAMTGDFFVRRFDPDHADQPATSVRHALVSRARQEVGESSYVGGMVTASLQGEGEGHDAIVAAADTTLRTDDGVWSLSAQAARSTLLPEGGAEPVVGTQASVTASRDSGERLVGAVGWNFITPEFDVNDLGYVAQPNQAGGWYWLQARKLDGLGPFRQLRANHSAWVSYLMDSGDLSWNGGNININSVLNSYWSAYAGVGYNGTAADPYEVQSGGALYFRPPQVNTWAGFTSDTRLPVVLSLGGSFTRDQAGGMQGGLNPSLELKAGTQVELGLSSSLSRGLDQARWGFTDDVGQIWFGERDYYSVDITARSAVTFTRALTLQFFGQYLTALGTFDAWRTLDSSGTQTQATPSCALSSSGCPAGFEARQLNTNAIFRWEYAPGSTLYAVWTREQDLTASQSASTAPSEDADSSAASAQTSPLLANNTLMLKLSYRWGT